MKINLTEVSSMPDGKIVYGTVYIQNLEVKVAKNQKRYGQGFFVDGKTMVAYKVWGDYLDTFSSVFQEATSKNSPILYIEGKINVFNDSVSVVITNASLSTEDYSNSDFICGHNREVIEKEFYEINKRLLSLNAYNVLDIILKDDIKERFFLEYAGMKMHDACPSGVANHTLKMLKILEVLLLNDERLLPWKDILVLGIDFHDIGKIREMSNGSYCKNSFVSHREFGVEILHDNKSFIVSSFDEDFYYRLISIIRGHHDEFEEKAKTVYARIVHLIDMLDAQVSHYLDVVEGDTLKLESSGDSCIDNFSEKLYV